MMCLIWWGNHLILRVGTTAGMRTSAICCMFATGKSTMMLSWAAGNQLG